MTKPPFRADQVGSLLRPQSLKDAREKMIAGALPPAELKAMEDAAIRKVVAMQEEVGLYSITDGEFRRTSFHFDFLGQLEGVVAKLPGAHAPAPSGPPKAFAPPTLQITGKVRHVRPIEAEGFRFLKATTKRTAKLTIPSPTMMLRGGRDAVSKDAYPDLAEYHADVVAAYRAEIASLAAAGCTYLQLDDTNFAYLCDPAMRETMKSKGQDLDALPRQYAKLINDCIAARPKDMAIAIHLCRGNLQGRFAAEGGYEPIAEVLFNALEIDGYFLEYDTARAGGFEPLRFMPKGKRVVLGLLSSKVPTLEKKDDIKRRIDEATKFVASDDAALGPQCGFASSYKGNPVSDDDQRRKLALIVETATEVWGTAQ
jgi:5-methyltetrahydropteroyltriglutamate--homocysteine methyltransferase